MIGWERDEDQQSVWGNSEVKKRLPFLDSLLPIVFYSCHGTRVER
ncbi:hypothetical protein NC99_17850 [Sunxiuqinia dokdonensis]|uniref:Uncharacterized protein n=1 Tax=Sunxiuqinia dokdonensis TaxID=1409788 RepID=A0A0L8VAD7_9BACT|nr:hypothetical protein NC99_17850 [Sunxiuqinia dokdonensis]